MKKQCGVEKSKNSQRLSEIFVRNYSITRIDKLLNDDDKLNNNDWIYYYIVTTVEYNKELDEFEQKGSGPNLEGNLITLCTCKHWMRTYPNMVKGNWVAGITSKYTGPNEKGNYLFYLTQIDKTHDSHKQLWFDKGVSVKTKLSKCADLNVFGDLYRPLDKNPDEKFGHRNYHEPMKEHVHLFDNLWHEDVRIKYRDKWNRPKISKLITGHKEYSYIWSKPYIKFNGVLADGQNHVKGFDNFFNLFN